MKSEFKGKLLLGIFLFFLGVFGFFKNFLGIRWHCGIICLDLDTTLALTSIWATICSYIAYKKYKSPNSAFIVGLIFGPFGILYYLIAGSGMSNKERELHDWEVEKKYKQMVEEKAKK